MFMRFRQRRYETALPLLQGSYLDARAVYLIEYDRLPCICFVGELNIEAVFTLVQEQYRNQIQRVLQHSWYSHEDQRSFFSVSLFLLSDQRILELGEQYCMILHTEEQYSWAQGLTTQLAAFRVTQDPVMVHRQVIGFARQNDNN